MVVRRLEFVGYALLIASALLGMGCAHVQAAAAVEPPTDTDGILRLMGRYSDGHACAISETRALTCAHMVDFRPFDMAAPIVGSRYEDGTGATGVVDPLPRKIHNECDLAVLSGEFKHFYPMATAAPEVGEHLRFLGYDWRDKKRAYAPRQISAKVLRIKAGHLILDPDPTSEPGSSGSCVLNDRNEVVAINCFVMKLASAESVAVVVGVWGEWKPDLSDPPVLNFQ